MTTVPLTAGATQVELAAGARVGPWRVERRIGGGGFGTVYEAVHTGTARLAALKVLHARLASAPEMNARFEREVDVLRRLSHRSIVHLVDAGFSAEGAPYLCMELLVGETLAARLARDGRRSPAETIAICEALCSALAASHALGIVHRDLNAANVFMCSDGRVMLLDFGIAKLSDALAPELTASHQSLGTPAWMAPEQIHGHPVDARTDIYALGGLLFHILTGRAPFDDPSVAMTQYLHLHARRPRASQYVAVSTRVDDVLVRAMAIEPGARFAEVRTLSSAFHAALRDSAIHPAAEERTCVGILVEVASRASELDAKLLDEIEAVLPAAERMLAEHRFTPVLELGTTVIFAALACADPVALAQRIRGLATDPRVRIGVAVHRATAVFAGDVLQSSDLLSLAAWRLPQPFDGVHVAY